MNWLGREATQILKSVDAEISSTQVVFKALERVFKPESNQTLARFKFRKMQQKVGQTCDSYMSELKDLHCLNVCIKMMLMSFSKTNLFLDLVIKKYRIISWER